MVTSPPPGPADPPDTVHFAHCADVTDSADVTEHADSADVAGRAGFGGVSALRGFLGHQVASSNSSLRSSGITGMGSGSTVMHWIDGVPPTPPWPRSAGGIRCTKLTVPSSGSGFG